jgi:hypothetical protein
VQAADNLYRAKTIRWRYFCYLAIGHVLPFCFPSLFSTIHAEFEEAVGVACRP